jgi:hypothetical protein
MSCTVCRDRTRELGQLRQRVERAESAARITIEMCRKQGISLGRGLANWAAQDAEERLRLYRIKFAVSDGGWDAGAHLRVTDELRKLGEPGLTFGEACAAARAMRVPG